MNLIPMDNAIHRQRHWLDRLLTKLPNAVARAMRKGRAELAANHPARAEIFFHRALISSPTNAEAWHALGLALSRSDKLAEAEVAFRSALAHAPHLSETMTELGIVLLRRGSLDDARTAFEMSLAANPLSVSALTNFGLLLIEQNDFSQAETHLRKALEHHSGEPQILLGLARIELMRSRPEVAARLLREAIQSTPDLHAAHLLLAQIFHNTGDFEQAASAYVAALALQNDDAQAQYQLGMIRLRQNLLEEASDAFFAAAFIDPKLVAPHLELARIAKKQHALNEAEDHARKAAELDPNSHEAFCYLGFILHEQERFADAVAAYDMALSLKPDYAEALNNAGHALNRMDRYAEAAEYLQRGTELAPNLAEPFFNLGVAHFNCGTYLEALAALDRALVLRPGWSEPRWWRALTWLVQGEFSKGWEDYPARFSDSNLPARLSPYPQWRGGLLHSQTILVYAEQGVGDEIMFASCLPDLIKLGGRCVVECDPRLVRLFSRSFPEAQFVADDQMNDAEWLPNLPPINTQIAVGDLPSHFRRQIGDFPHHGNYLRADPKRVEHWRIKLATLGPGLKIGISWRGGLKTSRGHLRSISLARWLPVLRLKGVHFINLQYGPCKDELDAIRRQTGVTIHNWEEAHTDFDELAALLCAMDIVVSVCTAVIHLAGALGRPTWVLVPAVPEWRYLSRGEHLPWYPSVKMFRQHALHDWKEVIQKIASELEILNTNPR